MPVSPMSPIMFPETNPSLLLRLSGTAREQAWFEFVELYRPAILRLAARKGLQHGDCEDLAQSVLLSVAGAIQAWETDPARGKFRTWLHTIAQRRVIDALRRRATAAVSGGSSVQRLLEEREERGEDSSLFRMELKRQAFRQVAHSIRDEFQETTWNCFWLVAVEGLGPAEAARQTGKSIGAVYAAKGRVARRLIERIRELEPQFSGEECDD
ncbi:MAG: RNA polymerase sigma factor [Planctomycetales bacterium]